MKLLNAAPAQARAALEHIIGPADGAPHRRCDRMFFDAVGWGLELLEALRSSRGRREEITLAGHLSPAGGRMCGGSSHTKSVMTPPRARGA